MHSTFKVLFYLKRNKEKKQALVPVMGRITVNEGIAQFSAKLSVPEHGKSAAVVPKAGASRPTGSTVIWIISVSRSVSTIRLSAIGIRSSRPRR